MTTYNIQFDTLNARQDAALLYTAQKEGEPDIDSWIKKIIRESVQRAVNIRNRDRAAAREEAFNNTTQTKQAQVENILGLEP